MEFKAEMLKQAQEMYVNRLRITLDAAQILKATEKTPLSPLQDHPDLQHGCTCTRDPGKGFLGKMWQVRHQRWMSL